MHRVGLVVAALAGALITASTLAAQDLYDIGMIRTIDVTVDANWRTIMANNYPSATYIRADLTIDGQTYRDVGVRHRGFSTYRFLPPNRTDKRPWKISIDEFVPGQRVQGYRTLNINNNVWDPSFVREVAGYEFMRRFVPAPKCCYVRLRVNGEDLGLFCNTQQINKDFLQEWFEDDEGNRYRGEPSNGGNFNDTALTWLGPTVPPYQNAYELKTENGPPPWNELIDAIDVLNNTPIGQLPGLLPQVVDVDDALRFLAAANITAWLDSYIGRVCHNFYLYADRYHGRLRFQPWDMNNGFGGLTDGLGVFGVARMDPFRRANSTTEPRPLLGRLVQVPAWRARYLAHYRHMLEEFDWARTGARIDQLRTMIRPELLADAQRIYTMTQFDQNLTQAVNVGFVTTPGIQPFFVDRNVFLRAHPDLGGSEATLSALAHMPVRPTSTQTTWVNVTVGGVSATAVTLYHRIRGAWSEAAMFDDGMHQDGQANDGVYGGAIPPKPPGSLVRYYVGATTAAGIMGFLPRTAELAPPSIQVEFATGTSLVLINEFVAANTSGIQDEAGEFDDWLELRNTGSTPVDIGLLYLTDRLSNPTKWQIPANTVVPAGGTVLVWCDENGSQGPLHANFKLSASGEEIHLFAADGVTLFDSVVFGPQRDDVSTGRVHGFPLIWATFPAPTPRAANTASPCGHLVYDRLDSLLSPVGLAGTGLPQVGGTAGYVVAGAPPSTPGAVVLSPGPSQLDLGSLGSVLVDPTVVLALPVQTDAGGGAMPRLPIPNDTALASRTVFVQAVVVTVTAGGFSTGVLTRICP